MLIRGRLKSWVLRSNVTVPLESLRSPEKPLTQQRATPTSSNAHKKHHTQIRHGEERSKTSTTSRAKTLRNRNITARRDVIYLSEIDRRRRWNYQQIARNGGREGGERRVRWRIHVRRLRRIHVRGSPEISRPPRAIRPDSREQSDGTKERNGERVMGRFSLRYPDVVPRKQSLRHKSSDRDRAVQRGDLADCFPEVGCLIEIA